MKIHHCSLGWPWSCSSIGRDRPDGKASPGARFMIWIFQVFGGTNSLDGVLHLLWMVQTQTAGSYSFSDGTAALWLHFLLGTNWILLFPNRTEKSSVWGRIKAINHIAWLKFFSLNDNIHFCCTGLSALSERQLQNQDQGSVNAKAGEEVWLCSKSYRIRARSSAD